MRSVLIPLAACLVWAGTAAAQVAAPSLVPTPVLTVVGRNPAVVPWDAPTRVALDHGIVKIDRPSTPAINPDNAGTRDALAAEAVGQNIGASIQYTRLEFKSDPSQGSITAKNVDWSAQLGAQLGGRFSVGIGLETSEFSSALSLPDKTNVQKLGATLRLADSFYLGAELNKETEENTGAAPPGKLSRNIRKYGAAYRWRDKERGVHVEVYRRFAPANSDPAVGFTQDEANQHGATVEFVFASILVSYGSSKTTAQDVAGVPQNTVRQHIATIGYTPMTGLALVASSAKNQSTDPVTGASVNEATTVSAGAAIQF